jgi:hypothetical protein
MGEQRTMRCGRRRWNDVLPESLRSRKTAGEQANRRGFDVAFAAGDLSGKAQPRLRP